MNLKVSKHTVLIGLMILSAVVAVFGRQAVAPLRRFIQPLVVPLGDGGMYVVTSLKATSNAPNVKSLSTEDIRELVQDNQELRNQLFECERQLSVATQYWRSRLEEVQQIRRSSFVPQADNPCELIPARVSAADALFYGHSRVVNSGQFSGARPGSPVLCRLLLTDRSKEVPANLAVITASALVGRLAEGGTGAFTAQLQLITSPEFRIQAKVIRRIDPNYPRQIRVMKPNAAAMEMLTPQNNAAISVNAVGDGIGGLIVPGVYEYERPMPGDLLVTREDDPCLRTEVRIGVVDQVTVTPENHQLVRLRVRPLADLAALRDVYIVYWNPS